MERLRSVDSEYKKKVLDSVHNGLISSLGIASTDIFIVINEPPLENWGMGGVQKE